MAGFIPDSLPPVNIYPRSSMYPYGSWSHRSATSPVSTTSPTSILPHHRARASESNDSRCYCPETPTIRTQSRQSPDSATSTRHIRYTQPDNHDTKFTPSPTTTKSPSPAPARALDSKQKTNFSLFGRSASAHATSPKPKKRKKLIKKSLSQPTFIISNPRPAADDKALKVEAAQLGLQLEEAVAAIEHGSTNVSLARVSSEVTTPSSKRTIMNEKEPAHANIGQHDDALSSKEQRQAKRWINAPLLPELDFGSSSTKSDPLFDSEAHKPQPRVTVCISTMTDAKSTSKDANLNGNKLTYRCDIHAQDGASHSSVEKVCQDLVTSAGGQLLNSYFYPGGFLYRLPSGTPEPITTCETFMLEAKINVEGWTAFAEPRFDGLRMHPPEGRLGGDRPSAWTSDMTVGLKAREGRVSRAVDTWVESQGGTARKGLLDRDSTTRTGHDNGGAGDTAHTATTVDDSAATPTRNVTLVKSLELLRRRVSSATRTVDSTPTSAKTARSPEINSENRYTVVMDTSESDSGSGAEEWESVRSEL
jgi:hypothetical protein